jgi:hypothetical protein
MAIAEVTGDLAQDGIAAQRKCRGDGVPVGAHPGEALECHLRPGVDALDDLAAEDRIFAEDLERALAPAERSNEAGEPGGRRVAGLAAFHPGDVELQDQRPAQHAPQRELERLGEQLRDGVDLERYVRPAVGQLTGAVPDSVDPSPQERLDQDQEGEGGLPRVVGAGRYARTTTIEGAETIARTSKALFEAVQPSRRRRVTTTDGLARFTQEMDELALGQVLALDPLQPYGFVGEWSL